jgi:hypothetical protein
MVNKNFLSVINTYMKNNERRLEEKSRLLENFNDLCNHRWDILQAKLCVGFTLLPLTCAIVYHAIMNN